MRYQLTPETAEEMIYILSYHVKGANKDVVREAVEKIVNNKVKVTKLPALFANFQKDKFGNLQYIPEVNRKKELSIIRKDLINLAV